MVPIPVRVKPPPAETRGHPAEQRHRGEHDQEGAGKQPLQVLDTTSHAHLITDGANDVITAQQREEIAEGPQQGPQLFRLDVYQAFYQGRQLRLHVPRQFSDRSYTFPVRPVNALSRQSGFTFTQASPSVPQAYPVVGSCQPFSEQIQ